MRPGQLPHLEPLHAKAAAAFPPPLPMEPYEGPCSTPGGDRALATGRAFVARRRPAPRDSGSTGALGAGFPSVAEIERELGGVEGWFTLWAMHYVGMFGNPRMRVLFDTRDPDTACSALEHGKRVASTLLDEVHRTSLFEKLGRGFSGAFAVLGTHAKAKRCPLRPKSQQTPLPKGHRKANCRFTTQQRDSWVGHAVLASEQCGASAEFQEKLGSWLAMTVSAYAPFVDPTTGQLDWMEESPYG